MSVLPGAAAPDCLGLPSVWACAWSLCMVVAPWTVASGPVVDQERVLAVVVAWGAVGLPPCMEGVASVSVVVGSAGPTPAALGRATVEVACPIPSLVLGPPPEVPVGRGPAVTVGLVGVGLWCVVRR